MASRAARTAACCAVVCVGVLVRLACAWWLDAGESIAARVELATPVDRIELLRETMHLLDTVRVEPAEVWGSHSVHHSPLLLLLPRSWVMDPAASSVLWTCIDAATGAVIAYLAHLVVQRSSNKQSYLSPAAVAAIYLLNPYAVATCVAKSMSTLRVFFIAAAVTSAVAGASRQLAFTHTAGCILFYTPVLLTPPLLLLGAESYAEHGAWRTQFGRRRSDAWSLFVWQTARRMVLIALALLVLSALLSQDGTWRFLGSVYGSRILIDDLAPSSGTVWYFFVQIFAHFRAFFTFVVNVHLWAYVVPITLKYRAEPLFSATVLYGVVCLFQNYPSLGDTALFVALWSLFAVRLGDYLRYPMVTFMLFAYSTLLLPAFHYLWLYAGSANANFYFAINLVHAIALGSLVLDGVWAWGRERWELERTPAKKKDMQTRRVVVQA